MQARLVPLFAVALVFAIIAARGFDAALRAADDYGFFLATVLTLFLTLPVLVMGAGMLGLVPLTGVVTPFLSFGGSAIRRGARWPLQFCPWPMNIYQGKTVFCSHARLLRSSSLRL